jgi:hypothetical protein
MSTPCQNKPIPLTFIGKAESQARINYFITKKYLPLCKVIGKSESTNTFYSRSAFCSLMDHIFVTLKADGLRIYFASYSAKGGDNVPANYEDLLTLIFAPTVGLDLPKDMGIYYSLFPGQEFDTVKSQLNRDIAKGWVENYRNKKLLVLNTTIDLPATQRDTRAIHYTSNQISDLKEEMKCQKASGIKAYYSAVNNSNHPFYQRLLLTFVLTTRIGADDIEFHIEDQEGFENRPKPGDFDTGNPCPPAYCDGEDLP